MMTLKFTTTGKVNKTTIKQQLPKRPAKPLKLQQLQPNET
jgi:hypothetical protein